MRFATVVEGERMIVASVVGGRALSLELPHHWRPTVPELAGMDARERRGIRDWVDRQPEDAWRPLDGAVLGPAVPEPGSIYTIGLNYRSRPGPDPDRPDRPMVYGKVPSSVAGHEAILTWDRALTANVDAEVELGVVIGSGDVFGYTIVNDVSSRDEWLDGDQWLLGKSMPGFCPVGPWVVTADQLDPTDIGLGCTINGSPIQDGRTADMRFSIAEIIAFLGRHVTLRPGDLIATGTPARLAGPLGPERHLQAGDVVTCWIEGIGELTTTIA
jgi:2-keto-4-pentenoate hydratase/2-oxohepta-3-ene-1,7-dioic acid hydratase in catechol pathway